MLKSIRDLAKQFASSDEDLGDDDADKRFDTRFPFDGIPFAARLGKIHSTLRMKDLSCGGSAGLLDEPVAVGDILYLELDDKHHVEAEVRWVRRIMVGLRFTRPLEAVWVQNFYANLAALKASEDDGAEPSEE